MTLKLIKGSIERAKNYAKKSNQSLSVMVENYFNTVADKENKSEQKVLKM